MAFETDFEAVLEGFCSDLEPPWAPSEAAKVVISLRTSSKNALLKKQAPKVTSQGLQDASRNSFDLQECLKRDPQSDAQATMCAQNIVNTDVFY